MADGNIAVDVSENEAYYIGDFRILAENLKSIRMHLTNVMCNITQIANQVERGANQVSAGAQALSQGAAEQRDSIDGLVSNITDMTEQIQNSAVRCADASSLVDRAAGFASEADTKMEQLKIATKNIDESSMQIRSIIKTIEDIAFQTNLLALNASVEAAHAGSAGKGFSAVSEEVRNLASKSTEAVGNTGALIGRSIEDVKTGTESTNLAISAMQVISECIQSIKTLIDEIALASVDYLRGKKGERGFQGNSVKFRGRRKERRHFKPAVRSVKDTQSINRSVPHPVVKPPAFRISSSSGITRRAPLRVVIMEAAALAKRSISSNSRLLKSLYPVFRI